jgi:SAM-dependent methyltransferase
LHKNRCHVTALEIDPEAIKKVAKFCDRTLCVNLNDPHWFDTLGDMRFDRIVAADVLEHLTDPLATLSAIRELLDEDGQAIISLPHVGHAAIMACLLTEDFCYRDWGLLDKTHIRFFGLKNMQALFEQAGLKIIHAEFVVRHPENTEFIHQWHGLPRNLQDLLLSNPLRQIYQVVIKAVSMHTDGIGISLFDVPVFMEALRPLNGRSTLNMRLRKIARLVLSEKTRRMLGFWRDRFRQKI